MMERHEFFKVSHRQQVAEEISRFFHFRHLRLQRLILDENLYPEEKARVTLLETECDTLENILAEELYQLDKKVELTQQEIEEAKLAEKHR